MTASLKVGVQLPEDEYVARWPELREMAVTAEEIGLDSIWLGDHLIYREPGGEPKGPWECLSLLSALAAVTKRVELGPLVLAAGFRNPAVTAKMAETIDEISGGRLILGLGAGWNEAEFRAFDIPYDHRVSRFEESFDDHSRDCCATAKSRIRAHSITWRTAFCCRAVLDPVAFR